jgi:hypothetical protein
MGKVNVKNGTPVGNAHLCNNCSWGQFVTGYRESDRLAICTNTSPNLVLPFTVYECTGFNDKHRPNFEQMKNLAINFKPFRISRTTGFRVVEKAGPVKREGDEDWVAQSVLSAIDHY